MVFYEDGGLIVSTKKSKISKLSNMKPLFCFCKGFVVIVWWGCAHSIDPEFIVCDNKVKLR